VVVSEGDAIRVPQLACGGLEGMNSDAQKALCLQPDGRSSAATANGGGRRLQTPRLPLQGKGDFFFPRGLTVLCQPEGRVNETGLWKMNRQEQRGKRRASGHQALQTQLEVDVQVHVYLGFVRVHAWSSVLTGGLRPPRCAARVAAADLHAVGSGEPGAESSLEPLARAQGAFAGGLHSLFPCFAPVFFSEEGSLQGEGAERVGVVEVGQLGP